MLTSQVATFIFFIYQFIYLSIHWSIYSFIHLFIYPFICSFIYSFMYLSIHSYIYLFIYFFIYSFFFLSIHSSIYLSIELAMHDCLSRYLFYTYSQYLNYQTLKLFLHISIFYLWYLFIYTHYTPIYLHYTYITSTHLINLSICPGFGSGEACSRLHTWQEEGCRAGQSCEGSWDQIWCCKW